MMAGYRFHRDDGLPDNHSIFVFESNLEGDIPSSAEALLALRCFGARPEKSEGMAGRSYALPMLVCGRPLPIHNIMAHIIFLHNSVISRSPTEFFIPASIGKLAGHSTEEIAPLFCGFPDNCIFPSSWRPYLEEKRQAQAQFRRYALAF